jgi:hypothetical protein
VRGHLGGGRSHWCNRLLIKGSRFSFWAKEEEERALGPASVAGKSKPYCELGKLLDNLARAHAVRGPYNIASYLKDAASYEVSGQMVSKYLYGHSQPKAEFMGAFAEAFRLTLRERAELAWGYAYNVPLPWDRLCEPPASAR